MYLDAKGCQEMKCISGGFESNPNAHFGAFHR